VQPIEDKRGPGLKFPPPLLVLVLIGTGYLADSWLPLPITQSITQSIDLRLIGLLLVIASLLLALLALYCFLRAKTHVEPWQPTTVILQSGIFAYSRNPISLAFCIATLRTGLLINSWWGLGVTPVQLFLLQRLVINREEFYLEQKFGADYLAYKRRVRRWL
jgi:protein-S-isoprenylcysteine O-methyltransferase Ste14